VERDGAEFERDADDDEGEPEDQTEIGRADFADADSQLVELQRAGYPVHDREAVQQRARGDCAEHEVLHCRLGRDAGVAIECDHRVQRERQQLDAEIHRQQAARRNHHHHAEQRDETENEILALE
jgi:hypothetical protein